VYLKLETELPTGSFRSGAVHALSVNLSRAVRSVVAASTGNHGAAVAYADGSSACRRSFLPANPNPVKAARIRDLGATLVETEVDQSRRSMRARAATSERHVFPARRRRPRHPGRHGGDRRGGRQPAAVG
jgi:threonine dehydratase